MELYLTILMIALVLCIGFFRFERRKARPRDIVPIAVMSVIGALGRVLFAAVPNFKPTTAIVIITGMQFGPMAGFMTGALSALASNLFLGQGPWTLFQMLAYGLGGLLAGLFQKKGYFKFRPVLYSYGLISGILFGWFLNLWYILGYVSPITPAAIMLAFAASAAGDIMHGISTVLFLVVLERPWGKKLERLKLKYGICSREEG